MVLRQYKLSSFGEAKRLLSVGDIYDQLLFSEKLYVFNNDGRRVGRFSIRVDVSEIQSCKMLVVHISNRGILDGRLSESLVTGVLTMSLKTVEELRHELSEMDSGKHIRRFYLLRERTRYYYSVTESVGEIENKYQSTIPFAKTTFIFRFARCSYRMFLQLPSDVTCAEVYSAEMGQLYHIWLKKPDGNGLVGEAGNILLMRALVVRGYEGIICVKTILSNGKRFRNYYISKLAQRMVNGLKTDVVILYRSVTDHCDYNVTSTCSFTKAGQLLNVFWSNSEYFLHIDPDLEVHDRMPKSNAVGLPRHWNRDKQIFSFYLDRKVEIDASVRSYRLRNQELKRITADWLQLLLLTKPSDILCSAIQFFTSFGNKTLRQCGSNVDDQNIF